MKNETPIQDETEFKRYKNEYGILKQGTKVWCNGYAGVIVRHYDGATYEVRVPGGVVATDDFQLTDKDFMFQKLVEEQNHRSQVLDTINLAVDSNLNTVASNPVKTSTQAETSKPGIWDEKSKTWIRPSGTVKQGRRPMFEPFDDTDDTCPKCGSSVCTHIWELEPSPETRLEYTLGGKDDPHFQDHGGNVIPDRVEANEDFCDMHQELRDDGRSDGQGESYSERNT